MQLDDLLKELENKTDSINDTPLEVTNDDMENSSDS